MVQVGTRIPVVDKSGAQLILLITVLRGLKEAKVGDRIVAVVKKAVTKKTKKKLAQKGKIYDAVVVKRKILSKKQSGLGVKFERKGVIILKKNENEPFSSRVRGPVSVELRKKGYLKILSMASYVI